jgi:ABC-type Zn uptake system ZnuABC Zn-binding protein ZnuA
VENRSEICARFAQEVKREVLTRLGFFLIFSLIMAAACSPLASTPSSIPSKGQRTTQSPDLVVLASTTFLADIARNVAGSRLNIESILPVGADPHNYQPVPADLAKISMSSVLILNGAEYEKFLEPLLESAGGKRTVIEASAGVRLRKDAQMEYGLDPHMWLDPNNVIIYVQNIRDGLIQADPQGEEMYRSNAQAYIARLIELDAWIAGQVALIPPERRMLVTNHETLGYFADRYGFKIAGTVLRSASSEASVSARDLSDLINEIKAAGVPVIFLDKVENPIFAQQIAAETGVQVVDDLHLESLTNGPPAPTYIEMMRYNVTRIVQALK